MIIAILYRLKNNKDSTNCLYVHQFVLGLYQVWYVPKKIETQIVEGEI